MKSFWKRKKHVFVGVAILVALYLIALSLEYVANIPQTPVQQTTGSVVEPITPEGLWAEANKHRSMGLLLDQALNENAQAKCNLIVQNGVLEHGDVSQMAEDLGRRKVGENLASGFVSVEGVVAGWSNSPGHNANLVDPDWKYVGYGVCESSILGTVVVQHFSSPPL